MYVLDIRDSCIKFDIESIPSLQKCGIRENCKRIFLTNSSRNTRKKIQHNYTFVYNSFANAFHFCLCPLSFCITVPRQLRILMPTYWICLQSKKLQFILNSTEQRNVGEKVKKFISCNDLSMYRNMKDRCIAFFSYQKG